MEIRVVELTELIMVEIFKAFGLSPEGRLRRYLEPILHPPARRFSIIGSTFDHYVAEYGFSAAARWALPNFIKDFKVLGEEKIPREGPLLVVSNHPGTVDSLAIAASLGRSDIKIIAGGIPFLGHLPYTSQHMIFATQDTHDRMRTCRAGIRQLQQDGALLVFPSGRIDPDPSFMPEAPESINRWSPSIELFLRKVPHTKLMITIVSGVLSSRTWRNPLVRLRKEFMDRQRLAEFIQIMTQLLLQKKYDLIAKVSFEGPLTVEELLPVNGVRGLLASIQEAARNLLRAHFDLFTLEGGTS